MEAKVSIIIPAWNEAERIERTLSTLREQQAKHAWWDELIVVDDGSVDDTSSLAKQWADHVIRLQRNYGKGTALQVGSERAAHAIVMFLDADLEASVVHARQLLLPVMTRQADMTIAKLPAARHRGGIGLVKRMAAFGIYHLSGYRAMAPLSGQRALHRSVLAAILPFPRHFGIEVGMTIDAVRQGYTIQEIELPFQHRETGRQMKDWLHRGKQFTEVSSTLLDRWKRRPTC